MPKTLTAKDFISQPWKNGGGSTVELYRIPDTTDPQKFLFRLSVAKVETPGPFSQFEGIDRQLILLKGNGMKLVLDQKKSVILSKPYDWIEFAGESSVECDLLDGPGQDFNVMVDRQWGKAQVRVLTLKAGPEYTSEGGRVFVYDAERESLHVFTDEKSSLEIGEGKTLIEIRLEAPSLY